MAGGAVRAPRLERGRDGQEGAVPTPVILLQLLSVLMRVRTRVPVRTRLVSRKS